MAISLEELGLTKNESKVFRTLLRFGKSSSYVLSKESRVPYGKIYNVLASLEHKGLVKVLPEKGKKFIPGDPESLRNIIEKKRTSLDEIEKEIGKMKQAYELAEREPVEIARGKRNFYKIINELPRPKKILYNIKYNAEMRKDFISERGRKGIIAWKDLVRVDSETEENVRSWLKVHKNIRAIPNEGVAVAIRDDAVMIALIKSNTMLLIRDKPFVNLMRRLFENYYEHAEKIEGGK